MNRQDAGQVLAVLTAASTDRDWPSEAQVILWLTELGRLEDPDVALAAAKGYVREQRDARSFSIGGFLTHYRAERRRGYNERAALGPGPWREKGGQHAAAIRAMYAALKADDKALHTALHVECPRCEVLMAEAKREVGL